MVGRRPYGFRKPGWRGRLVLLFLVPFVAVGIGGSVALAGMLGPLRAIDRYQTGIVAFSDGPVRVSGRVTRDQLSTSPLGKTGLGWVGAVGVRTTNDDGAPRFEAVCVRSDLSELHVQDASLTFARPSEPVVLGGRSRLENALPIVDIDVLEETGTGAVPEAMQRLCGASLTTAKGPLSYREAILPVGATVEVAGCRSGARIARCPGGGPYLVTTGSIASIRADGAMSASAIALLAGMWNLVVMSLVSLMAAERALRSTPTFQERLRAK